MSRQLDLRLRAVALLLFLVVVILYGWNSDDAYHGYIMAKHLAEGKGFVYNVGHRTTASTHPLLTLLEAFVFLFTDSPDICGLLLGLLFSGLASWILFFRFCRTPAEVLCALGLLVCSHCFMSYTTAGLENSILFFLGAAFLLVYFHHSTFAKRQLFAIALIMSLLAMTRADSVLVFIPMAVWGFLVRTKTRFYTRFAIGIAGLLPFVGWTFFSLLYYGFPFPNTYYAKLHTGIPLADYVTSGLWYYLSSWMLDPTLLLVPLFFVALSIKSRKRETIPLILGFVVYGLYLIYIGGDFMGGRHLTQQFFLSVCGIMLVLGQTPGVQKGDTEPFVKQPVLASALVIVVLGFFWRAFALPAVCRQSVNLFIGITTNRSAVDERAYWLKWEPRSSLVQAIPACFRGEDPREDLCRNVLPDVILAHERGFKGFCGEQFMMTGSLVWRCRKFDMFLTDIYALPDPLIARLKVETFHHWRIGHASRDIPLGYRESLVTGENRIANPALHEYYDKLLLVMRGRLFDPERLRTILNFNTGKYDPLLEKYEQDKKQSFEDLFQAFLSLQNGKGEDALSFLDQCVSRNASYASQDLAQYYRKLALDVENEKGRKAEMYIRESQSGSSDYSFSSCIDSFALLLMDRGEFKEAIDLWEQARTFDSRNNLLLWNLSLAYRKVGDAEKADDLRKQVQNRTL